MDQRIANMRRSARPSTRALALLALLLVLVLGCWRASSLFTQPQSDWVPASPVEASLLGILEPVTGKGNVRLSVTEHGGSARTVLILLSSEASDTAATVERLAASVAMIEPAAGDQLIIEQTRFANGLPGRLSPEGWTELGLFGLLSLLLVWIGFVPFARTEETQAAVIPQRVPLAPASTDQAVALPAPRQRAVRQAEPEAAADIVRKDPARTASILRSWMRGEGGAA